MLSQSFIAITSRSTHTGVVVSMGQIDLIDNSRASLSHISISNHPKKLKITLISVSDFWKQIPASTTEFE